MAGPEVPQHGALNIGYNYQPVETRLNPPIQLPGTGELWANVGKTAMAAVQQAGQMIQNSRLNPAFAAQQDYQQTQYDTAADRINELQGTRAGRMTMAVGPEGLSTVPAARTDIDPMVRMALRSNPAPPPPPPPAPGPTEEKKTPQQQGQDDFKQHPENYILNPATGSYERKTDAPPLETTTPQPKAHTTGDELTDNRSASATNYAGPSQADVNAGVAEALSRNRFASSEQGVPADYQPPQPGGGSIWSPMRPAPAAPPAPGAPPPDQAPAQPATGGSPAAATLADKASMQQWQEQNAHPVMSSQDALSWMKNQTTLAQDATYLPMGGPGGSPAYAFHMKGGGINTVPVSQMVQKGAGPLVAAQNTSQVISSTDQAQQGPGAQGQPPAPQTPQIAQGPPAAPAEPLPGAQGQPPAPQGPPPAPGAYDPTPYRQAVAQATANPQNLTADTAAAGQPAAAQPAGPQITDPTDFNANVRGYSQDELNKMTKDPDLGNYAGFNWRQDRTYGGKYAVMRDGANPITKELRWNAGLGEWVPTYKENGQLMEQLMAARAKVPLMNGMLSDTQIGNMSEQDLKATLDEAVRLSTTGGDASDQNSLHIRGTINQSQSLARTISMLEAAKKEGISPRLFSGGAQRSSEEAGKRGETLPAEGEEYPLNVPQDATNPANWGQSLGADWDMGWAALHGSQTNLTRGQISPLADQVKQELKYFTEQMQQTPGINVTSEPKGEKPQVRLGGGYQGFGGSADVKLPADESTLKAINRISQGNNIDDMIAGAKQLKLKVDNDIVDSTDRATRLNYRTPPQFKKAVQAIKDGKNIEDNENQFVDKNGNPQMPDHFKNPPGMAPKIPIGTGTEPNTQVEDEMKRFYGNRPIPPMSFDTQEDATKYAKGAKSGSVFRVKDDQGKWHTMRVD